MASLMTNGHERMSVQGVTPKQDAGYNVTRVAAMRALQNPNSHLPACWLQFLVCPRRYLAVLPSQARPNLFGSD